MAPFSRRGPVLDEQPNRPKFGFSSQLKDSFGMKRKSVEKMKLFSGNDVKVKRAVGRGAFGVVYEANLVSSGLRVALKKVPQDSRFKNRELDILKALSEKPHENIITLLGSYKTIEGEAQVLNLLLEFIPDTLSAQIEFYAKNGATVPNDLKVIYMRDAFRALKHLNDLSICHRDIKPQNLLVDPTRKLLKLADFGSAKVVQSNQPNISYICSRFYRAPELVLGATKYTTAVDVWGMGCVFAELFVSTPIFPGRNQIDLLIEMFRLLGTPTKEDLVAMNPEHVLKSLPNVTRTSLRKVIFLHCDEKKDSQEEIGFLETAVDLLGGLFVYDPRKRLTAKQALAHKFFSDK